MWNNVWKCCVDAYHMFNNIYYSIIYPDPRQIGGEFEKEYNTSIWNYRIDTKDGECIYKYDLDYCIEIPRM